MGRESSDAGEASYSSGFDGWPSEFVWSGHRGVHDAPPSRSLHVSVGRIIRDGTLGCGGGCAMEDQCVVTVRDLMLSPHRFLGGWIHRAGMLWVDSCVEFFFFSMVDIAVYRLMS